MNDFRVEMRITPYRDRHYFTVYARIVEKPLPGALDRLKQIFNRFAMACNLGLLAARPTEPEGVRIEEFRFDQMSSDLVKVILNLSGFDYRCSRVLIGMLRGEPFLDGLITSVLIDTVVEAHGPEIIVVYDEKTISLPETSGCAHRYEVWRYGERRASIDRLVRVVLPTKPSAEIVSQLMAIQDAWLAICRGGIAPDDRPAHECFISAGKGYMISPMMYEIPIDTFDNVELCFDFLLAGLDRFAALYMPITKVRIY